MMSDAQGKLSPRRPGFLLFESGCLTCTHIAETVGEMSGGALVARGLHEPEVKDLLDANVPGWRPRPMLVRFLDGGEVRVHSGASMVAVLAKTLGPRRSVALTRLLGESEAAPEEGISRRAALLRGGSLVGAIALGSAAIASPALGSRRAGGAAGSRAFAGPDQATVAKLRGSPVVKTAIGHLGPVDWSQTAAEGDVFVLRHKTAPKPASAAYTATDGKGVALSFVFIEKGKSALIEWMLPDGHHLTTTELRLKNGKLQAPGAWTTRPTPECSKEVASDRSGVREMPMAPRSPEMSKERLEFLISCMSFGLHQKITGDCVYACYNCAGGSPMGCISCANCAGMTGINHLKLCLQGCPPA
jgi:hypothetical protein